MGDNHNAYLKAYLARIRARNERAAIQRALALDGKRLGRIRTRKPEHFGPTAGVLEPETERDRSPWIKRVWLGFKWRW